MTPRHIIPTPTRIIDGDAVMDQIGAEMQAVKDEYVSMRWSGGVIYMPPTDPMRHLKRIIDSTTPEPARHDDKPHPFFPLLTFARGLWALAVVCAVVVFAARWIAGW